MLDFASSAATYITPMKKPIKPPLLSIIIPVYNRQDGLNILLSDLSTSILAGSFEQLVEIIVIDDYSSTPIHLPTLSATLSTTLPCSSLIERNSKNMGAPFSRERGFKLSRGAFIHFHDSDDSVTKNWLSDLLKELTNHANIDLLVTARIVDATTVDTATEEAIYRYSKIFHRNANYIDRINRKLRYQNCIGPLGGVTFSRRVLLPIQFMNFASCQDWQMYISALKHAKRLKSCPHITYRFNISGDDRISHHPRKKLLGHLQLSRLTSQDALIKNNIRLFYLAACETQVKNYKGLTLIFYRKEQLKIQIISIITKTYWKITAIYWRFF